MHQPAERNSDIFTRPSKRVEMISKEPSSKKAFEVAEEWASKIRKLGMTDRFGMQMDPLPHGFWGVYLIDRSIPEDDDPKSKGKKK
ncbi:hypothetical protein ABT115_08800 [Streptomyces sp. NPDC001832]|uniref:hypothetical protein n=1 Tax=Streptomyces sp. NPDC001832 TaxID=3154527 RepID=UPI00332F7DFF